MLSNTTRSIDTINNPFSVVRLLVLFFFRADPVATRCDDNHESNVLTLAIRLAIPLTGRRTGKDMHKSSADTPAASSLFPLRLIRAHEGTGRT